MLLVDYQFLIFSFLKEALAINSYFHAATWMKYFNSQLYI